MRKRTCFSWNPTGKLFKKKPHSGRDVTEKSKIENKMLLISSESECNSFETLERKRRKRRGRGRGVEKEEKSSPAPKIRPNRHL